MRRLRRHRILPAYPPVSVELTDAEMKVLGFVFYQYFKGGDSKGFKRHQEADDLWSRLEEAYRRQREAYGAQENA